MFKFLLFCREELLPVDLNDFPSIFSLLYKLNSITDVVVAKDKSMLFG